MVEPGANHGGNPKAARLKRHADQVLSPALVQPAPRGRTRHGLSPDRVDSRVAWTEDPPSGLPSRVALAALRRLVAAQRASQPRRVPCGHRHQAGPSWPLLAPASPSWPWLALAGPSCRWPIQRSARLDGWPPACRRPGNGRGLRLPPWRAAPYQALPHPAMRQPGSVGRSPGLASAVGLRFRVQCP